LEGRIGGDVIIVKLAGVIEQTEFRDRRRNHAFVSESQTCPVADYLRFQLGIVARVAGVGR
jgi:hypothetical protein